MGSKSLVLVICVRFVGGWNAPARINGLPVVIVAIA